ncbi:hypothetical protein BDFB_006595, partial [Asbolus verrucosus]
MKDNDNINDNIIKNNLLSSTLRHVNSLKRPTIIRKLSSASAHILDSGLPEVQIPEISVPELIFSRCEKYEPLTAI